MKKKRLPLLFTRRGTQNTRENTTNTTNTTNNNEER
jgi:hypothetical protein